jgi:hypothetical protein
MLAKGIVNRSQLPALHTLIQSKQGNSNAHHFRILATHHPIHYPPPTPKHSMKLSNSPFVAYQISNDRQKYIHLVLSGHTHALHPDHGYLPDSPRVCTHDPLDNDQFQFIVGSLMQVDSLKKRWPHAHQCQVLRFYQDPSEPQIIILHRLLAARAPNTTSPQPSTGGIGPYRFIRPNGQQRYEEEMTITL